MYTFQINHNFYLLRGTDRRNVHFYSVYVFRQKVLIGSPSTRVVRTRTLYRVLSKGLLWIRHSNASTGKLSAVWTLNLAERNRPS
jgi:hypothetical protein